MLNLTDPCLSLTETPEKVKDMPGVASGYRDIVNQTKSRMTKYTKDEEMPVVNWVLEASSCF